MSKGGRIDYSKWDHLDVSDSDDSAEEVDQVIVDKPGPASPLRTSSSSSAQNSVSTSRSAHVKIHPKDNLKGAPKAIFSDPDTFKPFTLSPDEAKFYGNKNWVLHFGLDDNSEDITMRLMRGNLAYDLYRDSAIPEVQFVRRLIENKMTKIEAARDETLYKCDIVLRVTMPTVDKFFRLFRLSGGLTLQAFQDRILNPGIGFCRGYHGYLFIDPLDGVQFGPKSVPQHTLIDMMHINMNGFDYGDDTKVRLADFLRKKGDVLLYLYDLGDQYSHIITLEEVIPADQSNGSALILEDSNGLDGKGSMGFAKSLPILLNKKHPKHRESVQQANNSSNYSASGKRYVPDRFDVSEANNELKEIFATKSSARWAREGYATPGALKPVYTNEGKDPRSEALCAVCGSPHGLKVCGLCKSTRYCSPACQKQDWPSHKLSCKKK